MNQSKKTKSVKSTKIKKIATSADFPSEDNFNLSYGFTKDLLEVPEDPASVVTYCQQGAAWINQEMAKPEDEWDVANLVKLLGQVAVNLKMLGDLDDALEFIETALSLVEEHDLGPRQFVAQSLRWADILRYRGDFGEAEEVFESILEICEEVREVQEYKDVALQHLGKLNFDLEEFDLALELFEEALKIRKKKKDQSLIDSTEMAIAAVQIKMKEIAK